MGLACAQRLARGGANVALLDLNPELLETALGSMPDAAGATTAVANVCDRAAVDAAIDHVRSTFGPIEIMVTSAGYDEFKSFVDITIDDWRRMIEVNLTGTFQSIQAAVPDMLAGGWGRIVTISSSSAQSGSNRMAHYVASKGGVLGLTKALALEFAPHGITVNSIPPGFIDTPMARRAEARGDLPSIDAVAARTPVRRAGTPEDIAAACEYLCSEDAGYITGQTINVNGGWYL